MNRTEKVPIAHDPQRRFQLPEDRVADRFVANPCRGYSRQIMRHLASALNDQIRRLSRREITLQTKTTRRLTAQYRSSIASGQHAFSPFTSPGDLW